MNELDLEGLPEWARLEIEAARSAVKSLSFSNQALAIEREVNKKQKLAWREETRYYERLVQNLHEQLDKLNGVTK